MKESPVKNGDVLADKYLVESVLGVGGMGVVVEVVHLELHETRAIKLMLPEALEEKDSVERFMREARAASRLKSEYVARVYDVGKLDTGLPYMVMEYLEGSDLRMLLKARGRIPAAEAIHYALQVCEALAEAHSAGIVHRDLKPGNLFLTTRADGSPCIKVLDFGISKQLGVDDQEMTKTHAVLGSPSYMSPEQMRSPRGVDARTDVWSLGVILYRLITGELPFKGENITELVTKVLQLKPRPPSSLVPELPKELDAVILRCLERDLAERYANVGELSTALFPFAPSESRISIERIARVLAGASHGRDALTASRVSVPKLSLPSRGSNDGWANTTFGSGTVSVRRWKLVAGAVGAALLAVGGVVGIVSSLHVSRAAAETPAAAAALPPVSTPPSPVTASPVATSDPKPQAPSAAPSPEPVPPPTLVAVSTPTSLSPPIASPPGVKGPLRTAAAKPAKAAEPPPVAAPPPTAAPTAAHRMFGTEN